MNTPLKPHLHPMIWVAALSVTAASLGAIGSMTGWMRTNAAETPPPAATPVVVAEAAKPPAAAPAAPVAIAATAPTSEHKAKKAAAKPHPQPVASAPREAIAAAGDGPATGMPPPPRDYPAPPRCHECGTVEAVRAITREGEGSGLGAVAGGVVGGALANNVGNGNGRTLATLAGAIGGALLGNKIEKDRKQVTAYELSIRMEDGTRQVVTSDTRPAWQIGDAVRVSSGGIAPR